MVNSVVPLAGAQGAMPVAAPGLPAKPALGNAAGVPQPQPAFVASPRLIIEEAPGGTFVYKTLNPQTGEVIAQLPREEVLRAKDDPAARPGLVIDTRS